MSGTMINLLTSVVSHLLYSIPVFLNILIFTLQITFSFITSFVANSLSLQIHCLLLSTLLCALGNGTIKLLWVLLLSGSHLSLANSEHQEMGFLFLWLSPCHFMLSSFPLLRTEDLFTHPFRLFSPS